MSLVSLQESIVLRKWALDGHECAGGRAQDVNLDKLRKVLKVLVVAARVLPEDEVPYTVARRLFGLEHFVEFETSDPASRSHLLSAAFELLDIAWQRSILVRGAYCCCCNKCMEYVLYFPDDGHVN